MPQQRLDFGAHVGIVNSDLRVKIEGPGRKNALSFFFSYEEATFGIFTEPAFWGRLIVFEGDSLPNVDIPVTGIVAGSDVFANPLRRYLDIVVHSPGPHSFLIPTQQQEGGQQSSIGGTLQAVLTLATAGVGETFRPRLTVSGLTLLKGGL